MQINYPHQVKLLTLQSMKRIFKVFFCMHLILFEQEPNKGIVRRFGNLLLKTILNSWRLLVLLAEFKPVSQVVAWYLVGWFVQHHQFFKRDVETCVTLTLKVFSQIISSFVVFFYFLLLGKYLLNIVIYLSKFIVNAQIFLILFNFKSPLRLKGSFVKKLIEFEAKALSLPKTNLKTEPRYYNISEYVFVLLFFTDKGGDAKEVYLDAKDFLAATSLEWQTSSFPNTFDLIWQQYLVVVEVPEDCLQYLKCFI